MERERHRIIFADKGGGVEERSRKTFSTLFLAEPKREKRKSRRRGSLREGQEKKNRKKLGMNIRTK